ncbi:MAG: GIY-YIG nuclease family protein [Ignavibacteria bacterium]
MYFVYILASKKNGTLYVGFTGSISKRVNEHKNNKYGGFSKKYDVKSLVYYQEFLVVEDALKRERQLKKWNRSWKIELIEKNNPDWKDLSLDLRNMTSQHEILSVFFNKSNTND